MHLIPALDHVEPAKFRDTAKAGITGRYSNIKTETAEIKKARQADSGSFEVAGASGKAWTGPLHIARRASALSTVVTIYTNGSDTLAKDIVNSLGTTKQMKLDPHAIEEFAIGPDGKGVVVRLQDGSEALEL
ncbi:hypothetical protein ACHAPJ_010257 [Fusarium lateritium]